MGEDEELGKFISVITSYEKPNRVLLFGSRARGQARPDSDYDLCVLYNELPKRNLEVMQDLYRGFFSLKGHPVDLVVYDARTFAERAMRKGSFEARITAEAKVVYG